MHDQKNTCFKRGGWTQVGKIGDDVRRLQGWGSELAAACDRSTPGSGGPVICRVTGLHSLDAHVNSSQIPWLTFQETVLPRGLCQSLCCLGS